MRSYHLIRTLAAVVAVAAALAGCASSAGSAKSVTAPVPAESLSRYTRLALETSARDKAATELTPADRERIAGLVARKVRDLAPERFTDEGSPVPNEHTLHVVIAFTRYDKGSAFARAMLIGLGQIHIDAEVTLEDRTVPQVIGTYDVKKTFAWGGLYGGFTSIEDVEEGFAEAVAKVVLGEPAKTANGEPALDKGDD